nr:heavy metal-associated domain-containing protein [Mycolicibacterium frederiksbergense]
MTDIATRRIELDVTGMSCGACSRRLENKLNKIGGVRASVAIATKVATIDARQDISVANLCDAVAQAGYRAQERTAATIDQDAAGSEAGEQPQKQSSAVASFIRWMTLGHLGGGAVRGRT